MASVTLCVLAAFISFGDSIHTAVDSYALVDHSIATIYRGDHLVARASVGDNPASRTVLTHDGRYYARLTGSFDDYGQPDLSTELVSISVLDGRVTRRPCPRCTSIAPVDESRILAAVGAGGKPFPVVEAFLVFNAIDDEPAAELAPTPEGVHRTQDTAKFRTQMEMIGSTGHTVFALGYDGASTITRIYTIDDLGAVHDWGLVRYFGFIDDNAVKWGLVSTTATPLRLRSSVDGGVALATSYIVGASKNYATGCMAHTTIDIASAPGRIHTLDIDRLVRSVAPGTTLDSNLVTRMWQTNDGKLHAIVRAWNCHQPSNPQTTYWESVFDGSNLQATGLPRRSITVDSNTGKIALTAGYMYGEAAFGVEYFMSGQSEWSAVGIVDIAATAPALNPNGSGSQSLPLNTRADAGRTRLTAVRPVDNGRNLKPGYSVERTIRGTCNDYPANFGRHLMQCSAADTREKFNSCWYGESETTAYCTVAIRDRAVVKIEANEQLPSYPTIQDYVNRVPEGVLLETGLYCADDNAATVIAHYSCTDGTSITANPSTGPTGFHSDGTHLSADHRTKSGTIERTAIAELFLVETCNYHSY
ncbi:hypothetical protein NOVA_21970 [Nocardia nova]|uniref:hypothetical protein n=1 Tax=Nocardia nova TaxID=37330 RepID=UPI001C45D91B|nr:hypothetical protein [Nocardia nova]MBV7705451.1 hypothetical protein [Nocardia nova]